MVERKDKKHAVGLQRLPQSVAVEVTPSEAKIREAGRLLGELHIEDALMGERDRDKLKGLKKVQRLLSFRHKKIRITNS